MQFPAQLFYRILLDDPDGRFRYFREAGIFNNDILRWAAPELPKMPGWIPRNSDAENLQMVSSDQSNNPNSTEQAIETGPVSNSVEAHSNANSNTKKKEGKKYYFTLRILNIPVLSNAPPDNRTRQEKRAEK